MRTYLFAWLWLIPVIVSAQFKDSLSCSVNDFTFEKQEGFDNNRVVDSKRMTLTD